MSSLLMVVFFIIFVLLRVPVAFSLGLSSIVYLYFFTNIPIIVTMQQMYSAVDKFTLMAIPFFIMAGCLMETGGISKRIVNFADALVGGIPGGLAIASVLASMLFSAMTGSGAAAAAAVGTLIIPPMVQAGYDKDFACALQATAAIVGPLIPPSVLAVIYGVSTNASVGDMLLAGFFPGVVMSALTMTTAVIISNKRGYKRKSKFSIKQLIIAAKEAVWALFAPFIILGGIYTGVFTPTEAAAVAVLYSMIVGLFVYKELKIVDLLRVLYRATIIFAGIMVIVGASQAFSWVVTRQGLPRLMGEMCTTMMHSSLTFLLFSGVVFLIVGCFMDPVPSVLILAPIMTPIAVSFGIDPIHYGAVMVSGMCVGLITPPVGLNVFVMSGITNTPVHKIFRQIPPFVVTVVIGLIIIMVFPSLSLYLPALAR